MSEYTTQPLSSQSLSPSGTQFLGSRKSCDMNSTADQAISISASKYLVRRIVVTNASTSLTLAAGGVYTAAAKGGTAIVAAGQVYSALTTAPTTLDLTLAVTNQTQTASSLFLSLTTAQGAAATADVYVFGDILP